jgi:hypothetical protein
MSKTCQHCGREETDDAAFCSHCRGRLVATSVFDGTTPKMYDEYVQPRPYIVWTFPLTFLETVSMTEGQFLARTVLVGMWLGLSFLLLALVAGSVVVALLFTCPFAILWYLMWKYGRKEAKARYW